MQRADALIGFWFPQEDISHKAPNLRLIHLIGAGANHLAPYDWLPPSVIMTTSSGVHAPMARDFATMAVLMLNHRIPFYASAKVAHDYNRQFSTGVWKKTLLIIGVGQMGGAAANGAKRQGMRVIGIRKSKLAHSDVDETFDDADLDAVIPLADFVLVATPLTEETRGMIGRQQLSLMNLVRAL
jgi:phosphoglycerate dehydrogenase-like enzyme